MANKTCLIHILYTPTPKASSAKTKGSKKGIFGNKYESNNNGLKSTSHNHRWPRRYNATKPHRHTIVKPTSGARGYRIDDDWTAKTATMNFT